MTSAEWLEDATEASLRSALSVAAPQLALRMNSFVASSNPLGDLHGYNQLWDQGTATLAAVVDFEESGLRDPHFDLRYLPGLPRSLDLVLATIDAYEQLCGRRLQIGRVMAWNVLTVLGDALWRTEAQVALPGGGSVEEWVDNTERRLAALGLG